GQNRGMRRGNAPGVFRQFEGRAAAFECRDERSNVAAAVIEHGDPLPFHRRIISRANGQTPGMTSFVRGLLAAALLIAAVPASAGAAGSAGSITVPPGFT